MTAKVCKPIELCVSSACRGRWLYLCTCLFDYIFHAFWLSVASLHSLPENKRLSAKSSVSKGLLPFLSAPVYFYPLPPPLCLHPSIPPFPRELSVPICTLLVTLSTYLVPTECLCNQTNTYPVVRHSNGRLIMKLLHCELTTG